MTKAFSYLRVSSEQQTEGDGFDRQTAAITKFAAANGISITQTFKEDLTGKTEMEHRPAFLALVEALEANGVKTVVIEKLDRLARDLMVQESIIGDFLRRGFTIMSTCEPDLCSSDPSRVLMRQMVGAFAQYERAMIVMRTKAARDRMRANGERCEGQKPFGSREGEEKVISTIQFLRAGGFGVDRIAAELNQAGHKTRHGKTWHGTTVSNILKAQESK